MNKLEMAHEYAKELLGGGKNLTPENCDLYIDFISKFCLGLADSMIAEYKKRNTVPEVDKDPYCYSEDFPVCKDEFVVDWSLAPEWAEWFCVPHHLKCGHWSEVEPRIIIGESTKSLQWLIRTPDIDSDDSAPSFNYQGDWKQSSRKRPE